MGRWDEIEGFFLSLSLRREYVYMQSRCNVSCFAFGGASSSPNRHQFFFYFKELFTQSRAKESTNMFGLAALLYNTLEDQKNYKDDVRL